MKTSFLQQVRADVTILPMTFCTFGLFPLLLVGLVGRDGLYWLLLYTSEVQNWSLLVKFLIIIVTRVLAMVCFYDGWLTLQFFILAAIYVLSICLRQISNLVEYLDLNVDWGRARSANSKGQLSCAFHLHNCLSLIVVDIETATNLAIGGLIGLGFVISVAANYGAIVLYSRLNAASYMPILGLSVFVLCVIAFLWPQACQFYEKSEKFLGKVKRRDIGKYERRVVRSMRPLRTPPTAIDYGRKGTKSAYVLAILENTVNAVLCFK